MRPLLSLVAALLAPAALAAEEPAPLRVGFLVVDGVYNSELMAPWDIFHHTVFHTRPGMEVFAVSPDGRPVTSFEGLEIGAHYGFADHPEIDVLVVPSAEGSMDEDLENEAMMEWVRAVGSRADYLVSLCDGAFVLAAAGLLDGLASTTFPGDVDRYVQMFPHLEVRRGVSFVHDGKALTSQGGARSYDVAMYLVDHLYGEDVARGVGRGMVIDWPVSPVRAMPVNLAHRGASVAFPENTIDAFEGAVAHGANAIETDLHLTRDGVIVLNHSPSVYGPRGGLLIADSTLAELRAAAPSLPTLAQAFDAVGDEIAFVLELKRTERVVDGVIVQEKYDGLPRLAVDEVRRRGWIDRTVFTSFYDDWTLGREFTVGDRTFRVAGPAPSELAELRALDPTLRLGLIIYSLTRDDMVARARALGCEALALERELVDAPTVDRLRSAGLRLLVWWRGAETGYARLLGWGVDGIFTGAPDSLRRAIGRYRPGAGD